MKAKHVADFGALGVGACAARKTFELYRGIGVRLGQLPGCDLRPETIEKFDQDFEIRIHSTG